MYIDTIDWVSLPNVLGMSQYAEGGLLATKPYCASGAHIQRMSDYCRDCRFDPKRATGDDACRFTTLYWDFLARNQDRLGGNRRLNFQLANLDENSHSERREVRQQAVGFKTALTRDTRPWA
jgi:deoxyribodipyrimidine photolyase-related protein